MATFYTGNTGGSTGPHLDFRVYNPSTGKYENPSGYTSYLSSGGNPFEFTVTSDFQPEGRVHPVTGKVKPHLGIDYATEIGTGIDIEGGRLLSTWNDSGGGGIMSQYLVQTENGPREFLMLHGSDQNKITGKGAVTDYDITATAPMTTTTAPENSTPTNSRQSAVERTQNYANMTKAELDAAYDGMRNDPAKARIEGMKMHKAFFNK